MIVSLPTPPTLSPLNSPTLRTFPNGLTVIAERLPVEATTLNIWLRAGSAVESDDINGIAHFLEHIIFKGSDRLPAGAFEREIERRGAITNAATSQDYTHYYITCAPKDFAELAPLQVELLLNPSMEANAFDRERMVVLEEIRRSHDNPNRRNFTRLMELAFDRLPYRRPVLGTADVVEDLTPGQMRQFHRRWYQPHNITAVAVGNLPEEDLIATVAESFRTAWRNEAQEFPPLNLDRRPEMPFTGVDRREFVDPSLQQARLSLVWRVPGMMDIDETYPLDILSSILGRGRTGRLVRELREEKGLVSRASVANISHQLQGLFVVSAQLPSENIEAVEAAIVRHICAFANELVQPQEIDRVRTQVANRFVFANEAPSDRANLYGYYQSTLGELDPALQYPQKIRNLEAEDLQAAARKYLSPEAYGVVIVRPQELH